MKRILTYIFIALCVNISLYAQTFSDTTVVYSKAMADSAYAAADYTTAVYIYEHLLSTEGEAASVYYNLGNSYYKQGEIARAILNYERALLIDPNNDNIQFNLELARSKAVDKNALVTELFLIRWIRGFVSILSADGWAKVAILCFIMLILCLTIFIFAKSKKTKKNIFIFALFSAAGAIVANIIAANLTKKMELHENAIVMEPSVTIRSTPSVNGTELFILHEGKKVKIKDDSMKDWKEIEIEDGNIGWLPTSAIEKI